MFVSYTHLIIAMSCLLIVTVFADETDETDGLSFNYEVVYLVLALVIGALSIYGFLQVFLCVMAYIRQRRDIAT
ncbi:hypothetical protein QR680_010352 [Steinernema hermaphroditum]|uniref:Uncharacterized protein n=1 Tax=Steinernema hermaphroditum TaxID=289476 RepID=A0AA39IQA4_9BILA|nr:hypothetical protein QR680_010352 [Steinernema hermaphroditum]